MVVVVVSEGVDQDKQLVISFYYIVSLSVHACHASPFICPSSVDFHSFIHCCAQLSSESSTTKEDVQRAVLQQRGGGGGGIGL